MIQLLRGAWRFHDFMLSSVKREFALRGLSTRRIPRRCRFEGLE
jgi:hypothetical protein